MGRVTALGILARMAYDKERTLDEVNALQMAVRVIANRHFQHERNWKRRRAAKEAMSITPPFVVREEGGTAAALPDGDGAEARQDAAPPNAGEPPAAPEAEVQGTGAGPRAPEEEWAERVRAVAARMRELVTKAVAEKLRMGPGALMMWLEGFASRLDQAVGDDPTPWTPYEGPRQIVKLPTREELKSSGATASHEPWEA
ncbi:MAG: hypothetical protein IJT88_01105 [Kiritimatiellae bacterium]|nr:hypothetical protein [Kiritimatiellia bacterium]